MTTDLKWFKSSYSGSQGECVEAALAWTRSTYSGSEGKYLEVATNPTTIHVRDSKDTARPGLTLSPTAWVAFTQAATKEIYQSPAPSREVGAVARHNKNSGRHVRPLLSLPPIA